MRRTWPEFVIREERARTKTTTFSFGDDLGGARLSLDRFWVLFCTCPDPALLVSAGTWVTFGGQITDEVRTDVFCHFPSVKVPEWETSTWSGTTRAAYFYLCQSENKPADTLPPFKGEVCKIWTSWTATSSGNILHCGVIHTPAPFLSSPVNYSGLGQNVIQCKCQADGIVHTRLPQN